MFRGLPRLGQRGFCWPGAGHKWLKIGLKKGQKSDELTQQRAEGSSHGDNPQTHRPSRSRTGCSALRGGIGATGDRALHHGALSWPPVRFRGDVIPSAHRSNTSWAVPCPSQPCRSLNFSRDTLWRQQALGLRRFPERRRWSCSLRFPKRHPQWQDLNWGATTSFGKPFPWLMRLPRSSSRSPKELEASPGSVPASLSAAAPLAAPRDKSRATKGPSDLLGVRWESWGPERSCWLRLRAWEASVSALSSGCRCLLGG